MVIEKAKIYSICTCSAVYRADAVVPHIEIRYAFKSRCGTNMETNETCLCFALVKDTSFKVVVLVAGSAAYRKLLRERIRLTAAVLAVRRKHKDLIGAGGDHVLYINVCVAALLLVVVYDIAVDKRLIESDSSVGIARFKTLLRFVEGCAFRDLAA